MSTKKRTRRNFSADEKVATLKRHLVDKIAVSDLCDELDLQPRVFYRWQQEFFERGAAAFASDGKRESTQLARRVEQLESKLSLKNEVLSELMEEHLLLKKSAGEL